MILENIHQSFYTFVMLWYFAAFRNITIDDTTAPGTVITGFNATDSDGDVLTFTLADTGDAAKYFYVDQTSNNQASVVVRQSLLGDDSNDFYLLRVLVSDGVNTESAQARGKHALLLLHTVFCFIWVRWLEHKCELNASNIVVIIADFHCQLAP